MMQCLTIESGSISLKKITKFDRDQEVLTTRV